MLAAGEFSDHSRQVPPPPETASSRAELTLPRVLCVLSSMIEKLVARNDRLIVIDDGESLRIGKSLKAFHGVRAPSINRLIHRHPDSLVVSLNVHRLLVTSVMVASKMLDDFFKIELSKRVKVSLDDSLINRHYNNAFYARVGGVSNAELNKLEIELLFLMDFGVMVSSRVFESYCLHLEKEMLVNGTGMKIEKALIPTTTTVDDDHKTEISVEDI
ncbi:cyclin-U1-1 [Senna tora]|uniref:Cyclin-U1-1 n=1 Tax=Senna tora TaxID=362788 RepID=A0A834WHP1_9FABA|nr:cyclin-U1-1 [Senna tora]